MLDAFLAERARRAHVYGEHDCALDLANWVMHARGVSDPAASFRGTYATEAEAEALIAAHGGFAALVGGLARAAGLDATDDPKPGDIAVVRHGGKLWGAIMTRGRRWTIAARRGRNGLTSCVVVAAWSVL